MENGPFEDVFPIENCDFPIAMLVYQRVIFFQMGWNHQLDQLHKLVF